MLLTVGQKCEGLGWEGLCCICGTDSVPGSLKTKERERQSGTRPCRLHQGYWLLKVVEKKVKDFVVRGDSTISTMGRMDLRGMRYGSGLGVCCRAAGQR